MISNEITVKIKCGIKEISKILEQKGFEVVEKFLLDDTYFIPETLNLEKTTTREILSKAVLIRDIKIETPYRRNKVITFKIKKLMSLEIY